MAGSGKGPLRIAIEDFIETFFFGKVVSDQVSKSLESAEDAVLGAHDDAFDFIDNIEGIPDFVRFKSLKNAGKKFQGGIASVVGFGAQMGMSAASSLMAPIMRKMNYAMDRSVKSARVDPPVAYAMFRRDPSMAQRATDALDDLGWDTEYAKAWGEITHTRIPDQGIVTMVFRGELSQEDGEAELLARGWAANEIPWLFEISRIIPPAQDVIRLAVREAFNPEAIQRFSLDADFPAEVGEWAEKQGLSREWAEKYWIAHWENPSLQMAFEMIHRLRPGTTDTPFTADDLDLLMRIQDVAPYWRERLKAISFAPYTRVDVRRMYGAGVLTVEQVKSAYLDLGYDDEHASNLTAFTTSIEAAEEKGLSRAAIQQAYKRKVYTRDQAIDALGGIGFNAEIADFWLDLTDWEIQQDLLNDEIGVAQFLYVEGEIDEGGVYGRLGKFNLPAEQVALLIRQWDIKRLQKIKLPTEEQLEDFYRRDIIPFETLTDTLRRKGYGLERVAWITQRIDQEQAEQAAKDAEAAQKEAERVELSTRTQDYQKRVAALRSDIAYLRLAIANLKASRYNLTDPAAIEAIPQQVAELQAQIAELNLAVSDERVSLLKPPAA
jgi:hypothetical protein